MASTSAALGRELHRQLLVGAVAEHQGDVLLDARLRPADAHGGEAGPVRAADRPRTRSARARARRRGRSTGAGTRGGWRVPRCPSRPAARR